MVDVRTNLLKNRRTISEKDYQRERDYLRYSIVGLIVVVIIVVAMSAWNIVLTSKMAKIDSAFKKASQEMQGLAQASAQQVYLISRLKLVTGFLADRSINREALQKILSTSIPGTHVGAVAFEDHNKIEVQYVADNVTTLNSLLSYYQDDTNFFTEATSKGLTRGKDGNYQLNVGLTIPSAGAK